MVADKGKCTTYTEMRFKYRNALETQKHFKNMSADVGETDRNRVTG